MSRRTLLAGVRYGAGTAIAGAIAIYWTLVLPRQLSVDAFAEWRIFLLYGGFVSVLHFGIPEALLYRWTKRRSSAHPPTFAPVAGALAAWHLLILAIVIVAVTALPVSSVVRHVAPALAAYGLVWSVSLVAQNALQAQRRWSASGVFTALSALLFAAVVASGLLVNRGGIVVTGAFVAATAVAAVTSLGPALATRGPQITRGPARPQLSRRRLVRTIRAATVAGFPLLVVNLLLLTLASADRMAVSMAFPRSLFATYAFAASLVAIANTGAAVAGRFAVPYVAAWARNRSLPARYPALILAIGGVWCCAVGVLLAATDVLGRSYPQYRAAVPLSFLMLAGVAFSSVVQVLQLPVARALKRSRASTQAALLAVGVGAVALAVAVRARDLPLVAATGSAISLLWWILNARAVVRIPSHALVDASFAAAVIAVTFGAWHVSIAGSTLRLAGSLTLFVVAGACGLLANRSMRRWADDYVPSASPE